MTHFLFAWELGANYGHLTRDLRVAEILRDHGHSAIFAVRDTLVASELLSPHAFEFVQAPLPQFPTQLARPPANYAEMLLAEGWGDRNSLHGLVCAWLTLFTLTKPDTLIADHSPTALLAARIAGLHCVAFGSGFEIPLRITPLPSIRPWENIQVSRLDQSENLVLGQSNAVLSSLGGKQLIQLFNIFPERPVLASFAELDHYGERENVTYIGSVHGIESAEKVTWKKTTGQKIVAYLRFDQKVTEAVLGALADTREDTICVVPGITQDQIMKYASPFLNIYSRPVTLAPLLANADMMISYGGSGSIAESLLAGVPMILIPGMVEQYLGATAVEKLGACILLGETRDKNTILAAIKKMLSDTSFQRAAQGFAEKYQGCTPEQSAALAAEAIVNNERHSLP